MSFLSESIAIFRPLWKNTARMMCSWKLTEYSCVHSDMRLSFCMQIWALPEISPISKYFPETSHSSTDTGKAGYFVGIPWSIDVTNVCMEATCCACRITDFDIYDKFARGERIERIDLISRNGFSVLIWLRRQEQQVHAFLLSILNFII